MNKTHLQKLVTQAQLALGEKIQRQEQGPLEIILWRLGFITTDQLASIL
ncbi:DUF2949 domain-containing protein [Anthocerotibacter panamensis]|nr:DUF2949 domain-containing protein [Anthocerotibacter panamensis]